MFVDVLVLIAMVVRLVIVRVAGVLKTADALALI